MSNISTDLPKEKLYAASVKQRQAQDAEQKQQQLIKQDPSTATGLQWAASQTQNAKSVQAGAKTQSMQIVAPSVDDTAMLSSTLSLNDEGARPPVFEQTYFNLIKLGVNLAALEQSFKEIYKRSKSHNLLMERFMSTIKMAGISMLMGYCGVDAGNIEQIKAEVREEALQEIDAKLSRDWAYAKAMLDIVG